MKLKLALLATCLFCYIPFLSAKKVLADLDFNSGYWSMVGIPVHNYKMLPIQEELQTFISKDPALMRELQRDWDLELTFEDKCDYHYELKFYRNGLLQKTLKLNLYCGYLSYNGLAYRFNPVEFERFRERTRPIAWSRINFADLNKLQEAIQVLNDTPGIFWYEDVQQYQYPGYFMLSVNALPWNADLDSLYTEVQGFIRDRTFSDNFYLQKYFHIIEGDKLNVRYTVNCDEALARQLAGAQYINWRSHLHNRDSISIVAIGVDRRRYWQLMNTR